MISRKGVEWWEIAAIVGALVLLALIVLFVSGKFPQLKDMMNWLVDKIGF